MATDYGRDLQCTTDLTPTLLEDTGLTLMRGVCCRRLGTPNQSLLSAPSERTTDLRQYLNTEQPRDERLMTTIRSDATAALKADSRIDSVTIVIVWEPDENFMLLHVTGFGGLGPFALTLRVDRVRVEALQ